MVKFSRRILFSIEKKVTRIFYSKLICVVKIEISVTGDTPCHPYEPFKCPGDGACISIQYLCDGAPDCPDGYDEDPRLCTAGGLER